MIKPNRTLSNSVLTFGFLFLYIPIISLVVYSFNESKLVTVSMERFQNSSIHSVVWSLTPCPT